MADRISSLRVFIRVARSGSFSRAARDPLPNLPATLCRLSAIAFPTAAVESAVPLSVQLVITH
jgi:hypothetical protein